MVQFSGKIQGDGRKFLDRFKSYLGSQISQSLNEVRIYRLLPKSATKGDFFHIFLSLIVSSWRHGLQMSNEADEVLPLGKRLPNKLWQLKTTENVRTKLQFENVES